MTENKNFSKDDLVNASLLKVVVGKADFNLKGDAVFRVASLFNWLNELEIKIDAAIKKQSKPTIVENK